MSGGSGYNTYIVNDNTTAVITSTSSNDKIVMNDWELGDYTLTKDGNDIILTNEAETVNLTFKNAATTGNRNIVFEDSAGEAVGYFETMLQSKHFYSFSTGAGLTGSDSNDYIYSGEDVSGISGYQGSDVIDVKGYTEVFTNKNIADGKDNSASDTVNLLGGNCHSVHAQSGENIINETCSSNDNYYAYLDQKTVITDLGGTDSLNIVNTSGENDGILGADLEHLNTYLFFKVSTDYDIESDMNSFAVELLNPVNVSLAESGEEHNGIKINNNAVETITTSDGCSITSADIGTLAELAASWLDDRGYTSYDDIPAEHEDLHNYTMYINAEAGALWS